MLWINPVIFTDYWESLDNYRISLQSVNVKGLLHNKENLKRLRTLKSLINEYSLKTKNTT